MIRNVCMKKKQNLRLIIFELLPIEHLSLPSSYQMISCLDCVVFFHHYYSKCPFFDSLDSTHQIVSFHRHRPEIQIFLFHFQKQIKSSCYFFQWVRVASIFFHIRNNATSIILELFSFDFIHLFLYLNFVNFAGL